jgi:hypothetical protein
MELTAEETVVVVVEVEWRHAMLHHGCRSALPLALAADNTFLHICLQ